MYLWSRTPGSGKTFLACCLARSLMIKYDLQMRFITAPDYIDMVGEKIKLDDIGAQSGGEWQRQEIFRLVNDRMETGKITIYTSNMSTDSLNVDSRTRDRIVKASVELQMPEESLRRKKAEMEQQQFLREVLGLFLMANPMTALAAEQEFCLPDSQEVRKDRDRYR